jgi:hypothetical protein
MPLTRGSRRPIAVGSRPRQGSTSSPKFARCMGLWGPGHA